MNPVYCRVRCTTEIHAGHRRFCQPVEIGPYLRHCIPGGDGRQRERRLGPHGTGRRRAVEHAASAKAAARSVGQAAKTEGISQLGNLANKYFGGAGTPAQAIRVCAYNVTTLRKIVVQFRRELSSMSPSEFLRIHAKVGLNSGVVRTSSKRPMNERLSIFTESAAATTARQGGYSAAQKRKLVARLKKRFHGKPPSKVSREGHCHQFLLFPFTGRSQINSDFALSWV